jgi:hypothetical protein
MGTRWEAVLVQAPADSIRSLPTLLLSVADQATPRIRFTFVATRHRSVGDIWCLECFGVNKNPLHVHGSLPGALGRHPELAAPLPLAKQAAFSATVAVALAVAPVVPRATYVFYSDGLSRSGAIRLRPQPVESQWSEPDAPGGYGHAAVQAARRFVGDVQFIEDVWESFEGDGAIRMVWRLLDRHKLLAPPEQLRSEHC